MAFGFGFNKQKVLSAAEKCVQQGKLQNAISEYQKILKHDPKDLTVMNTIGDLHARVGERDKAIECFRNVGDAYAVQGFTVKAIAMYKKLSKIKPSLECVLRLAELYTQQGLFNDARAQYLQVAEEFIRTGQLEQAVRIFEKTLEMDPENTSMRSKLAEVYVKLGKKEEAWKLLSASAETLRAKGQLLAAEEILQKMLKLEPNSSYALVMRGRAALEAGDLSATIDSLGKVADIDSNPEALRALFQAYLRAKRFNDADALAAKLATVHEDNAAIFEYLDALLEAQQFREALRLGNEYSDRLLRQDSAKFMESLRSLIGHLKEDSKALETVAELFIKAGENSHLTEIYELLAHAYVQSEELEKAREYYLKLTQLEPENQMHSRNYQQVLEKLGSSSASHLITAEQGTALVDELEATAPFIEQRYDDEITLAVRAALTDAELFISYNMPEKALDPLVAALPKAPRDLRLNQKLAALHTRAERFAEAAVCCRTLESIYHDAGHAEEASRYADLAGKYEQRSAGVSGVHEPEMPMVTVPEAATAQEFAIAAPAAEFSVEADPAISQTPPPVAPGDGVPSGLFFHAPAPPSPGMEAQDLAVTAPPPSEAIDLSSEWEQDLSVEAPGVLKSGEGSALQAEAASSPGGTSKAQLDEGIEEVRFYLGQGMTEQAEQVLAKLESLTLQSSELQVLRHAINSAKHGVMPPAEACVEIEQESAAAVETSQPWPHDAVSAPASPLQDIVSDLEASLGEGGFAPASEPATTEQAPQEVRAHSCGFRAGTLDEFVSDLEASLGSGSLPERPANEKAPAPVMALEAEVPRAAAASASATGVPLSISQPPASLPVVPAAAPSAAAPGVDLSEMFGELKHELEGDVASTDEDPETHYNLGVAFREMGLLDEAVGEFQKVCQAVDHGHAFPQLMQAYTWLAQCFLDKGVPEAAVRWYERALNLPSIDQETRTALHYELASSFESAGNRPAALSNFLEVYGSNIDYRDVAERIKALRP